MSDPASLENLHTIMLPEQTGLWPPAPGWYLLFGVFSVICIYQAIKALRRKKANIYRKRALALLNSLQDTYESPNTDPESRQKLLRQLPVILKTTALAIYPRSKVARLYGDAWLSFLDQTLPENESARSLFQQGPGRILPMLSICPPHELDKLTRVETTELFLLARRWIRSHRIITAERQKHV